MSHERKSETKQVTSEEQKTGFPLESYNELEDDILHAYQEFWHEPITNVIGRFLAEEKEPQVYYKNYQTLLFRMYLATPKEEKIITEKTKQLEVKHDELIQQLRKKMDPKNSHDQNVFSKLLSLPSFFLSSISTSASIFQSRESSTETREIILFGLLSIVSTAKEHIYDEFGYEFFNKAYEKGDPLACYLLAMRHLFWRYKDSSFQMLTGILEDTILYRDNVYILFDIDTKDEHSLKKFSQSKILFQSAKAGKTSGEYWLSKLFASVAKTNQNTMGRNEALVKKSHDLFFQALNQDEPKALIQHHLQLKSKFYDTNSPDLVSWKKSIDNLQILAISGIPLALQELAFVYLNLKNYEKAFTYLRFTILTRLRYSYQAVIVLDELLLELLNECRTLKWDEYETVFLYLAKCLREIYTTIYNNPNYESETLRIFAYRLYHRLHYLTIKPHIEEDFYKTIITNYSKTKLNAMIFYLFLTLILDDTNNLFHFLLL